jgi:hypothetical protein
LKKEEEEEGAEEEVVEEESEEESSEVELASVVVDGTDEGEGGEGETEKAEASNCLVE